MKRSFLYLSMTIFALLIGLGACSDSDSDTTATVIPSLSINCAAASCM